MTSFAFIPGVAPLAVATGAGAEMRRSLGKAGAIPLTDVLDADRQLLVARNDVESTRVDAARAAVRTFRALGGGWDIRSNPSLSAVK